MKTRIVVLLSLLVVASLLLTACPAPTPQVVVQTVEVEKKVVETVQVEKIVEKPVEKVVEKVVEVAKPAGAISIWAFYDLTDTKDSRPVMLKQAIESFQATTGIKVQYEQVAWDQLPKKLALAAQAGAEMPDLIQMPAEAVKGLVNTGALLDIMGKVKDAPWYAEINPFEKALFEFDGARYGVGTFISGGNWYCTTADFPNGWPTKPADWLVEGERLKAEGKYIATFFLGKGAGGAAIAQGWYPLFASNGGHLFTEEGKPDWALPENVAVVEWMRELLAKGYVPETSFSGDWAAGEQPFTDKKAASMRGGSWSFIYSPGLKERYEANEVEICPPPSFGDKGGYVFMNSEAWGVTSGAKNIDNAVAWINFLMNPSIVAPWANSNYGIPTIASALSSPIFTTSEFFKATSDNLFSHGKPSEASPYFNESSDALATKLQEIMLNPKLDIMTELKKVQDEVI